MSIEFHAVSIPRKVYEKYRGTTNLYNLYFLGGLDVDTSSTFEELESEIRTCFEFDGELTPKRGQEFKSLLSAGEIPVDELTLGRDFTILDGLFQDEAPTVFGKCFGGGEDVGEGVDVVFGDDVQILAEGLSVLRAEEEDLQAQLSELKKLYSTAAANDWAVLRSVD